MNKDELASRLKNACSAVIAAQDELTEIDSHFGDADHGVTMTKIAEAVVGAVGAAQGGIKAMLEDAAMEVMMINGGSAVPLWNTWLDGLAEAAPEGDELDAEGLKQMLGHALEELAALSKAKVGDKTMMDALIPATEAALACQGRAGGRGGQPKLRLEVWQGQELWRGHDRHAGRGRRVHEPFLRRPRGRVNGQTDSI